MVCVFAFLLAFDALESIACGAGLSRFRLLYVSARFALAGVLSSWLAPFFAALVSTLVGVERGVGCAGALSCFFFVDLAFGGGSFLLLLDFLSFVDLFALALV